MVNIREISLDRIRAAQAAIRPFVHRTPIFSSRFFSGLTGAKVFLKGEIFQKTGSFKARGAMNKIRHFTADEKSKGILTVSAGNHAQAVAWAAATEGVACVVVMPSNAPKSKLEATRAYGAEVILHDDMRTIFDRTEEVRSQRGMILLHPFDDPDVIAGQGTVGLEIHEDLPQVDVAVVGIGGGALISGISIALKSSNSSVRIIGVEPEGAPTLTRALAEGKPVKLDKIQTIADGLSGPYAGKWTFEIVKQNVEQIALVSDTEMIEAIRLLLERAKLLVEPAGAAALAALLTGKVPDVAGRNVVVVLSGGNLSLDLLKSWLQPAAD